MDSLQVSSLSQLKNCQQSHRNRASMVCRLASIPNALYSRRSVGELDQVRTSRALVVALVAALAPSRAFAQEHPQGAVAPVASPATALRNPNLERTRRVVDEVIEKLRELHVDGRKLAPERCRESAIAAF